MATEILATATILQFPARTRPAPPPAPTAQAPDSDEDHFITRVRAGEVPGLQHLSDARLGELFRRLAGVLDASQR